MNIRCGPGGDSSVVFDLNGLQPRVYATLSVRAQFGEVYLTAEHLEEVAAAATALAQVIRAQRRSPA